MWQLWHAEIMPESGEAGLWISATQHSLCGRCPGSSEPGLLSQACRRAGQGMRRKARWRAPGQPMEKPAPSLIVQRDKLCWQGPGPRTSPAVYLFSFLKRKSPLVQKQLPVTWETLQVKTVASYYKDQAFDNQPALETNSFQYLEEDETYYLVAVNYT